MSKAKAVFAYICLVGIPVAGVGGVLWFGQDLVAPRSVSGTWNVEADFRALRSDPCMASLAAIEQPFLHVIQSGSNLTVRLGDRQKTILPGIITGTTVRIGVPSPQIADCRDPLSLQLHATVSARAHGRMLTGTLFTAGCTTCLKIPFRAVQENR